MVKMPSFKSLKEARKHADNNYLRPSEPRLTVQDNWFVEEEYGK